MLKLLLLCLVLLNIVFAKDILVLHSYHKGYGWSDDISKAIEENFKNQDVTIFTEYMDTKHIYSYDYKLQLLKLYQYKYKNKKFDIIIASDNNALNFLERFHDKVFQNTPIVFCGINNFNSDLFDQTHIKQRSTGVLESVNIERNIELIQQLHPNIKKLLVVNDTTTTGRAIKEEFFNIKENYEDDLEIEYIDKFIIADLQKKVTN